MSGGSTAANATNSHIMRSSNSKRKDIAGAAILSATGKQRVAASLWSAKAALACCSAAVGLLLGAWAVLSVQHMHTQVIKLHCAFPLLNAQCIQRTLRQGLKYVLRTLLVPVAGSWLQVLHPSLTKADLHAWHMCCRCMRGGTYIGVILSPCCLVAAAVSATACKTAAQ
jgi:hypothetical protein